MAAAAVAAAVSRRVPCASRIAHIKARPGRAGPGRAGPGRAGGERARGAGLLPGPAGGPFRPKVLPGPAGGPFRPQVRQLRQQEMRLGLRLGEHDWHPLPPLSHARARPRARVLAKRDGWPRTVVYLQAVRKSVRASACARTHV